MGTAWGLFSAFVTGLGYYAIFLVAVLACIKFFYVKYQEKLSALEDFAKLLESFKGQSMADTGAYENMKAAIEKTEFATLWKQYSSSLIHVGPDRDGRYQVYSTSYAEDYFNNETLTSGLMTGFWKNFGGTFTAIGILGTFLGLTVGLYGINIESKDLAVLSTGIQSLFKGLSTAFLTSVAGIILAIAYNVLYSRWMKKYYDLGDTVAETFDEIFVHYNAEQILSDSLSESREQTEQLKLFSSQLVTAISDGLNNGFQEQLVPVFNDLRQSIDKLTTSGMDTLAGSIDEKTGEQLSSFAKNLEELQSSMQVMFENTMRQNEETAQRLEDAVKALTDASNAANQSAREMFETANKSMLEASTAANQSLIAHAGQAAETMGTALNGAADHIAKTGDELSSISQGMKKSLEDTLTMIHDDMERHEAALKTVMDQLQATVTRNRELINSAGDTAEKFSHASAPMIEVSKQIRGTIDANKNAQQRISDDIKKNVESIKTASTSNANAIRDINEALKHVETAWKAYEDHFKGISGEMQKTLESLNKGVAGYNDLTNKALVKNLNEFDRSISAALGEIGGIGEDLNDSVEDLSKLLKQKLR